MLPTEFTPKLFTLLQQGLNKRQLARDALAGLIVGVIALPLAIAFAIASGVSPEKGLITAVVADGMIGSNHRSNLEMVAQGGANVLSALFGGIPATGAIARTAANIRNGGRTPVAGIVHALTLLIIMLALAPLAKLVPLGGHPGGGVVQHGRVALLRRHPEKP